MFEAIESCRSCANRELEAVLEFGEMPASDALVREENLAEPEPRYPLTVVVCHGCGLMQLRETVAPEVLFDADYPYYSSFSPSLLRHTEANVKEQIERRELGAESLVVEVASNDDVACLFRRHAGSAAKQAGIGRAANDAAEWTPIKQAGAEFVKKASIH